MHLCIGQKQFVINLNYSKMTWSTSGKQSLTVSTPNGPWLDRVEKKAYQASEVSYVANSLYNAGTQPTNNEVKTKGHIVIPYTQGLCKSIRKICSRYGIQTHFKGKTIKNLLISMKDKDPLANKSGAICWFQCGDLTCDDEYMGENSRTSGERFKEHLKEPSPTHIHSINTSNSTTQDNLKITGREDHGIARTIKESIYIRVNNPTLNRNTGKFNLHHIWERVLLNTPRLKIKGHVKDIGHAQSTLRWENLQTAYLKDNVLLITIDILSINVCSGFSLCLSTVLPIIVCIFLGTERTLDTVQINKAGNLKLSMFCLWGSNKTGSKKLTCKIYINIHVK